MGEVYRAQDQTAMTGERKLEPYHAMSNAVHWLARISPDGRWLAYSSSESGQFEIYVRSFPKPNYKVRISPPTAVLGQSGLAAERS
jgi:hypothetical protein